jgi:hypothetical protein
VARGTRGGERFRETWKVTSIARDAIVSPLERKDGAVVKTVWEGRSIVTGPAGRAIQVGVPGHRRAVYLLVTRDTGRLLKGIVRVVAFRTVKGHSLCVPVADQGESGTVVRVAVQRGPRDIPLSALVLGVAMSTPFGGVQPAVETGPCSDLFVHDGVTGQTAGWVCTLPRLMAERAPGFHLGMAGIFPQGAGCCATPFEGGLAARCRQRARAEQSGAKGPREQGHRGYDDQGGDQTGH